MNDETPLYADRPGFEDWKKQVDLIAEGESMEPMSNPPQSQRNTWIRHFNAGKTPAEAWAATPYRRDW